jgi:hypothetical protein
MTLKGIMLIIPIVLFISRFIFERYGSQMKINVKVNTKINNTNEIY